MRVRALPLAALLASCAHAPGSPALPAAPAAGLPDARRSAAFTTLFSFDATNGRTPSAALIAANGELHGTTYGGGAHDDGTVFAISTTGTQRVLHAFKGGADGSLPQAPLLKSGGAFYGTTIDGGGPGGEGVVFKVTASGAESVVHRFKGGRDGASPYAGLVPANGVLYGTTAGGGKHSQGTIFTISLAGAETVVHSFGKPLGDGSTPLAGLTPLGKALYGTTAFGGAYCAGYGCGAVFSIDGSGAERTIYSFGGKDGSMPSSSLIALGGSLYGTTASGGRYGNGIAFALTPSGKQTILHSFKGGSDGATPNGLTVLNGTLYGTTDGGGTGGAGTVFALATSGAERVLYSFTGGKDGSTPRAGLVAAGGTLYGSTAEGGANGAGTIFDIAP